MSICAPAEELGPELHLVRVAEEMPHHTDGGPFNPYDVELPGIETQQYHGSVEVVPGFPTEYTLETTSDTINELGLIFSGFGGIKSSSENFSNALAQLGLPNVYWEPVRKDDRSNYERLFSPHKVQVEVVEAILKDLDERDDVILSNNASLTAICHSMGGEPGMQFSLSNSDRVNAVILIATIGFGSPNIFTLPYSVAKGAIPGIKEELIPFLSTQEIDLSLSGLKKIYEKGKRFISYFGDNVPRTFGEIGSCLSSDQENAAHTLRESGVRVVYGQPVFDVLVQGAKQARKCVDVVGEIERAGHMLVQAKPGRGAHWTIGALSTIGFSKAS